ncbi:hypothetical protein JTB14_001200 [Gonioctena quinquepunctata]|nr:hypothetical protein JTB14_001200 [Gonioctena quinquepunctata]
MLRLDTPYQQKLQQICWRHNNSAKKCIPRGYRKEYIPGWSQNSDELYQHFLETGDQEIADELLHSLDAARREKWTEIVESLNFQTSSRQAWALSRKLGNGTATHRQNTTVSPNAVASHIVAASRAPKNIQLRSNENLKPQILKPQKQNILALTLAKKFQMLSKMSSQEKHQGLTMCTLNS